MDVVSSTIHAFLEPLFHHILTLPIRKKGLKDDQNKRKEAPSPNI